jgi:hypothetical protein
MNPTRVPANVPPSSSASPEVLQLPQHPPHLPTGLQGTQRPIPSGRQNILLGHASTVSNAGRHGITNTAHSAARAPWRTHFNPNLNMTPLLDGTGTNEMNGVQLPSSSDLDISASHNTTSLTYAYPTTAIRGPRGLNSGDPINTRHISYRQLLHQRLQKYQWLRASFHVEHRGPGHARKYRVVFSIRGYWMKCSDNWYTKKSAAKEEAARLTLLWLDQCGYV